MINMNWPRRKFEWRNGPFLRADLFIQLLAEHPNAWCWDYQIKYLTIDLDTREGLDFTLKDRDGNIIDPDRVLVAIHRSATYK